MLGKNKASKICPRCRLRKKIPADFGYRSYGNKSGKLYLHSYCIKCQHVMSAAYKKTSRGKEASRRSARGGARYSIAKRDAKFRDLPFSLTREEYANIRSKPCHYCGGLLPETGLGMDRIDNDKGYELGNVYPCCRWCNSIRGNVFTVAEMEKFIGPAIRQIRINRAKSKLPCTSHPVIGGNGTRLTMK